MNIWDESLYILWLIDISGRLAYLILNSLGKYKKFLKYSGVGRRFL